jgi:hypothetical protein
MSRTLKDEEADKVLNWHSQSNSLRAETFEEANFSPGLKFVCNFIFRDNT